MPKPAIQRRSPPAKPRPTAKADFPAVDLASLTDDSLLTDAQVLKVLQLGPTTLATVQREDPSFPAPMYLGPRAKRHRWGLLKRWTASKARSRAIETA